MATAQPRVVVSLVPDERSPKYQRVAIERLRMTARSGQVERDYILGRTKEYDGRGGKAIIACCPSHLIMNYRNGVVVLSH